ncbi:TolC family protein [Ferrovum sp. PN-J185]|uniref:TolC family protein n=1 Tax=Ferrovum sp. PN-J185 TaxID=1356306 RepID=UPI00079442DF|nr:TolC family protein [Ferrovum sp. PN-J185]KXW56778.1 outer membrane protein OprM precursor [Ferrovum sp. PN-J185]
MPNRFILIFMALLLWNHTVSANEILNINLSQAMQMAVENHSQSQIAQAMIDESLANQQLQRSSLLPNLSLSAYQLRQNVNLRAQGFSLPGFPVLIGPFNSFASSVELSQKIFDLSLWNDLKASQWFTKQTELKAEATFQQIAANAAFAYINLLRAKEELKTAQANLHLAQELEQLTRDQKRQGISTGVDVVRAQTQTTQYQYNLRASQSLVDDSQTKLKRALGIALETNLNLTDTLSVTTIPIPGLERAINDAEVSRPEILANEALISARASSLQARKDAYLPSIGVQGAIGPSGVTPVINDYHVYSIGVYLSMPLWNGGATQAEENIAFSQLHQAKLQLVDTKAQVDEDVRVSFNALQTTIDEVHHAQKNLELATTLMNQASDRYKNGVADNLEVVDAQTTLAQARTQFNNAIASQHIAWINFDLARGKIKYSDNNKGIIKHE